MSLTIGIRQNQTWYRSHVSIASGNIAEGVVEEMREDVDEHHKAGDEPHLAYADAAQPCRKRSVHARADVTDSRGLGCHAWTVTKR